MKIESILELKKLIVMLRQNGVHNIEIDGLKMQLDALPSEASTAPEAKNGMLQPDYTDTDILFFSSAEQVPTHEEAI